MNELHYTRKRTLPYITIHAQSFSGAKCDNLFEGVNIILVQFFQRIGSLNPTRFSDPITDLSHFQNLTVGFLCTKYIRNQQSVLWAKQRLRFAWASARTDQLRNA